MPSGLTAMRVMAATGIAMLVCCSLAGDELLPSVDVAGRAHEGRVGHAMYGEPGDVGRSDDAPDGKRGAELIAAGKRSPQWR